MTTMKISPSVMPLLNEKEIQEHAGKNQPENKFAEIIFPAEAAECFSKIAFVSMIKVAKK